MTQDKEAWITTVPLPSVFQVPFKYVNNIQTKCRLTGRQSLGPVTSLITGAGFEDRVSGGSLTSLYEHCITQFN